METEQNQLNIQLYGSLNEFVPIQLESTSSSSQQQQRVEQINKVGRYNNLNNHNKIKQSKVKLIERRRNNNRPQSASILNSRRTLFILIN